MTKLEEKLNIIKAQAKTIAMCSDIMLTPEQNAKIGELRDRMEFRLSELVNECKLREAEIKEEIMKEIITTIRNVQKK